MKIPGWGLFHNLNTKPTYFFNRTADNLEWIDYSAAATVYVKSILTALVRIEKCWIDRYLNYPHALTLGYNDSRVLRNHLREYVAGWADRIAKQHAPQPPPPPPPPPPAAAAAAAAAAAVVGPAPVAADVKSQYPSFAAAVSVFGRPVIPIGFTTAAAKNKTAGRHCAVAHCRPSHSVGLEIKRVHQDRRDATSPR
jgi:hypothetical protein